MSIVLNTCGGRRSDLRDGAVTRIGGDMRVALLIVALVIPISLVPPIAGGAEQRMVRVAIFDDTKARPLPPKAELWLKGKGSVWLHQACERLSAGTLSCGPLDLGMRDVGEALQLYVYPNGRKLNAAGKETDEVKVPFKLTADMCPRGCPRDMISVAVSDRQVDIHGAPVIAAGLKTGVKARRK